MMLMREDIFVKLGLLHELNRQFLHPLGLALVFKTDDETGECKYFGIQNNTDDLEGMLFSELNEEKMKAFNSFAQERYKARLEALGYIVQPA